MATDIIPKKPSQYSIWINILFYVSLLLLVIILIIFFVLNSFVNNAQKTLKNLQADLIKEDSADNLALKKEMTDSQKKINVFSQMLDQHLSNAGVFKIIEDRTHPKAFFSQVGIDSRAGTVSLSGQTQSFESLGQQLLSLRDDGDIKSAALDKIALNKDGSIDFGMALLLDPKIFKPVFTQP